jgi:hypothetical protein
MQMGQLQRYDERVVSMNREIISGCERAGRSTIKGSYFGLSLTDTSDCKQR